MPCLVFPPALTAWVSVDLFDPKAPPCSVLTSPPLTSMRSPTLGPLPQVLLTPMPVHPPLQQGVLLLTHGAKRSHSSPGQPVQQLHPCFPATLTVCPLGPSSPGPPTGCSGTKTLSHPLTPANLAPTQQDVPDVVLPFLRAEIS